MTKGRKPKTAGLKALEGNRGRRKIPKEPPAVGVPTKPADLCDDASTHWDFVVEHIVSWGICKNIDSTSLEALCTTWALWQAAKTAALADPIDKDNRIAYIAYTAQWHKLAIEFGMTPVARAKLAIEEQKKDDMKDFLLRSVS